MNLAFSVITNSNLILCVLLAKVLEVIHSQNLHDISRYTHVLKKGILEFPSSYLYNLYKQEFQINFSEEMIKSIPQKWRLLSGQNNWKDLLNPLDADLRQYILHYGARAQATYDTFNTEKSSKFAGSSRYARRNLFRGSD